VDRFVAAVNQRSQLHKLAAPVGRRSNEISTQHRRRWDATDSELKYWPPADIEVTERAVRAIIGGLGRPFKLDDNGQVRLVRRRRK
jgi:hypothetical protein